MRLLFILCGMYIASNITVAQNQVEGHVRDQEGSFLTGATVFIPDLNKGTITNNNGYFILAGLPKGTFRIQISFVGYSTYVGSVDLESGNTEVNAVLHITPIATEEIVVTSGFNLTQHENSVKIDLLSIQPELLASGSGFAEVLTKIPGVDMISKGNGVSKPVIRGLSMNDILVLNHGVRFENYQYSSHHPLGIDEFGIENIEVIKGPASLLYGSDAIGGVLNFIKEKPAPVGSLSGDYNLQLFSNTRGLSSNFGIKGASSNLFAGVRAGAKSHADFLQGGGEFAPNSRYNEYSLKVNAGYTGKSGTFSLYYDHNQQNLGLVEDEAIEEINVPGRKTEIFYQNLITNLLSSRNKFYLGFIRLDLNASWQNTELLHIAEPEEAEIQMHLTTISYETKLHMPVNEKAEYIVGFQGMLQNNNNINDRPVQLLPDADIRNYSLFGLLQFKPFRKLKAQAGLRYDYKTILSEAAGHPDSSDFRSSLEQAYNSFSGSLGITYFAAEDLLFRANVANAYRTPTLAELTSNGPHETIYELGDQELLPERSLESDVSFHYHKPNFTFDMAIFYNRIQDYIYLAPTGSTNNSGLPIYQYNQDNSFLYGGEAGFHFHPQRYEWLHIETTYSRVIGRQESGDYLPFIPADKLNFELRLSRDQWFLIDEPMLSVKLRSALMQNKPSPEETGTSGYSLLDLSTGGEILLGAEKLIFIFSVNNVFDKKYMHHLSTLKEVNIYDQGRNFILTLQLPFDVEIKSEK